MSRLISVWVWLSNSKNQKTLTFVFVGLSVMIGGMWQAYLHFSPQKEKATPTVSANDHGMAGNFTETNAIIATGDVNINGTTPSALSIDSPKTEQTNQKLNSASSSPLIPQVITTPPTAIIGQFLVSEETPLRILDDQVKIRISWPQPSIQAVNVDVDLPTGTINWGFTTRSTDRTFNLRGHTYTFRLISVSGKKAKITISRTS